MSPKPSQRTLLLEPQTEIDNIHHILNRMEDQPFELEQNIREYQTLTRMIKANKNQRRYH
jgi:phage shock protein A